MAPGPTVPCNVWPIHKTQCDPKPDYFRSSPSTEEEAAGLLKIHKHKLGHGSFSLTPRTFKLEARPALGPFCAHASESCCMASYAHVQPTSTTHALPPLSTWNKPNWSSSSESSSVPIATRPARASHPDRGKVPSNVEWSTSSPKPSSPSSSLLLPARTLSASLPAKILCKSLENFADQMLLDAYACWKLTGGQKKGKMLHETMHWMTTMQFMLKGMQEAWLTLPGRHKPVMEASVIGWHPGVYGLPDENAYTPKEFYLIG
ncbi:hypothetical protein JCM11641_003250 [Rhodosporidiobolus odoratus]